MKILPVAAELLHADGQTDRTQLVVASRNLANPPYKPNEQISFAIP